MKKKFDNAGVAQVQARILSLPAAARSEETNYLRNNFAQWMAETFSLSAHQQEQLLELNSDFLNDLAQAVADSWADGELILFSKSEPDDGKDPSPKDILLGNNALQTYRVDEASQQHNKQVSIQIRYRS